jgi:arylsulfatase A-like enzyme
MVMDALKIVDDTAARLRADAERAGKWRDMSVWVVSDHGHSRVTQHEDLVRLIEGWDYRTVSHPWVYRARFDVAVMVSGNAMAHVYVNTSSRERPGTLDGRWASLADSLLERPSVDVMLLRRGNKVEVRSRTRGTSLVWREGDRFHYRREDGDALDLGRDICCASADDAYDATIDTDYPDAVVQIVHLALAPRSGDIILSAARDWDFRARYEPIPHVSSHGALHREHMLVPLLVNRPVRGTPRRTTDVMPSALAALGKPVPAGLDGESYL